MDRLLFMKLMSCPACFHFERQALKMKIKCLADFPMVLKGLSSGSLAFICLKPNSLSSLKPLKLPINPAANSVMEWYRKISLPRKRNMRPKNHVKCGTELANWKKDEVMVCVFYKVTTCKERVQPFLSSDPITIWSRITTNVRQWGGGAEAIG